MPDETAAGDEDAVTTMFGPYRLDAILGQGGMGDVYRAHHVDQQRTVALKLLRNSLSAEPEYRERFLRESRIMAKLTEPHVIPVHDWGEIDGRLYIDMRLVDGQDLAHALEEHGPLPAPRAVDVIAQVARALDAAHSTGVVHRDVKPSNVLLTGSGNGAVPNAVDFVYLVDFGVARASTDTDARLTQTGIVLGTFGYIAPERLKEEPVDGRADVYSLGCMFYECLTGVRPFVASDRVALMAAHLFEAPPRVSSQRAGIPVELDEVIARAMAKDPSHRYPTAGAMATAAHAALAGALPAPFQSARQPASVPATDARSAAETSVPEPAGPDPAFAAPPVPRRRVRARIWSITAAVLGVCAVLIIVITRIDTDPVAQARSAPARSEPETQLLQVLPVGFTADNCASTSEANEPGVVAAVRCTGSRPDGPTSAMFIRFADTVTLDEALVDDADRRSLPVGSGTCRNGDPVRTTWMKNGKIAGLLSCYPEEGTPTLRWTDHAALAMGVVVRSDNGIATLYDWWTRYDFG